MDIINFTYSLFSDPYSWMAALVFFMGYTYTTKVDNTTAVIADHINLLQTEKIDRDGEVEFTGTSQWDKGADIASGATLAPGSDGNYFDVTGTTTITAINAVRSQPGTVIKLHFDGILKIVHHATNLILPDGKDIYAMAGTELEFVEYATDDWRCTGYPRGVPVLTNILSNSAFKVCSQPDAAKGICTIAYDTGAKGAGSAPSAGDAVVGANGATAKLISYTTATGDWATDDAAGVLTLGACTGGWTDDEVLTFGGVETAAVNGESIGVVNDPCNNDGTGDWTDADTILSFDTDHYEVASDAADEKTYRTSLTFIEGRLYKVEAQLKDGTAAPTDIQLISLDGAVVEYSSKRINTTAAFVTYSCTFEATSGTDGVGIITPTSLAGNNIEMKYFICYEIRGCFTGGDAKAFDHHSKTTTLDAYQVKDDSTHIEKSYYGVQLVKTVATAEYCNLNTISDRAFLDLKKGGTYTIGCFVYDDSGGNDNIKLQIYDGVATVSTPFFTSSAKQWQEVTITMNAAATEFTPRILCDGDVGDTAYISPVMVVKGSYIGEGNYQPKQQEIIWLEKYIISNKLNGLTDQSDVGFTDLNIEADSDGKLPKGCKAVRLWSECRDSGSSGISCYLAFQADSTMSFDFISSPAGFADDFLIRIFGWQPCNSNGDFQYSIDATGASTFDVNTFWHKAVQIN